AARAGPTRRWNRHATPPPSGGSAPPSRATPAHLSRAAAARQAGPRLLFQGAGEAGDVVFHEERINECHRDRPQQGPGHQRPPLEDVAGDELGGQSDGNRLRSRGGQEDERVEVLVPGQREGERSEEHTSELQSLAY